MPFFANRRTVLKGVLGAGVLAGVAAPDIASASSDECGVAHGWGKVADVFRANFEGNPGEVGAACSVYVGGRPLYQIPLAGPFNAVISHDHTSLGPCATSSGRTRGGWPGGDARIPGRRRG
jgi:hypothetical protein